MNIKQRAELTYKHNIDNGRHGWLRLTPAYSVKVVQDILANHHTTEEVLDPFSGTATTPLCASYKGHSATSIDINPFLVWLGNTKSDQYSYDIIHEFQNIGLDIIDRIKLGQSELSDAPPIFNIERWWDKDNLIFLRKLKFSITEISKNIDIKIYNLLKIVFCRTMIQLSNAAFNHQSMSFKDENQKMMNFEEDYQATNFLDNLNIISSSASYNPQLLPKIQIGDARKVYEYTNNKFDLVITSPPYPNRMSYIRELRPYMYWLDYLYEAREAGDLDWQTIGGTWGIATSRLSEWEPQPTTPYPDYFYKILEQIRSSDNKNGILLSSYIAKYFEDIWLHLQGVASVVVSGGTAHYIVGNSTFYNVLLPVENLYSDLMTKAGFDKITIHTIRKRNSKKELMEFDVVAHKV